MASEYLAYETYSRVVTSTANHRTAIIETSMISRERKFGESITARGTDEGKRVSRAAVVRIVRESNGVKGERNGKSIGASIKLRMHAVCRF